MTSPKDHWIAIVGHTAMAESVEEWVEEAEALMRREGEWGEGEGVCVGGVAGVAQREKESSHVQWWRVGACVEEFRIFGLWFGGWREVVRGYRQTLNPKRPSAVRVLAC